MTKSNRLRALVIATAVAALLAVAVWVTPISATEDRNGAVPDGVACGESAFEIAVDGYRVGDDPTMTASCLDNSQVYQLWGRILVGLTGALAIATLAAMRSLVPPRRPGASRNAGS